MCGLHFQNNSSVMLKCIVLGIVMNSLALTYCELKRPKDALPLQEQLLAHRKRALPANDPRIGDTCAVVLIALIS
jgi:hypothetical protein